MPIISNWGTLFQTAYRPSHGWRWTLAFWPLSWPVTSSPFDLKYWGQTWLVMWSVSSLARYWLFSQTASGILLCSVCNQFGEASVKRCFAPLFQTAILSMLQVWLENYVVHPSTRLALHMWVSSWVWSQAWSSILGYLAPMRCRHWCSCFLSWVEIRRWRLVARYTSQIVGSVARTW